MEITIIEEKKNRLVFELAGEDHTFCGLLKQELQTDSAVNVATYTISHPLVGVPRFVLETDGSEPRKVLKDATKRLLKNLEKAEELFAENLK